MSSDLRRTARARLGRAGRYALLVTCALVILFPIYAAFVVSMQPLSEFRDLGVLIPSRFTLVPYREVWNQNLPRYLLNGIFVTLCIVAGQVVTSILAGYAFAFMRFKGKKFLFFVVLASIMVPTEASLVGNLDTIKRLDWFDTYPALIVPFLGWGFGVFMMRQAFLGLPTELFDAAAMDGYSHLGFLRRVAVPLVRPSIAALSVFSFLLAWNQYLWPLMVTNDASHRTVQIGLRQLASNNVESFNNTMAGTLLSALPIAVLLIVFERQLVRGLTAGAVKG